MLYLQRRREVLLWSLGLYASWVLAWSLFELFARGSSFERGPLSVLWWLLWKILLWVTPVYILIRRRGVAVLDWLGLAHARGFLFGLLASALLVIVCAVLDLVFEQPRAAFVMGDVFSFLVITFLSPLFEEILFRGYALRALEEAGSGFWQANAESSILFVLLHLPGWLFMGSSLLSCLSLAPRIFLLGVLFGALRLRGSSLWSSVLVHVMNNAWSGGLLLFLFHRLYER